MPNAHVQPDITRFAPTNRRRLSAPALRTFISISDFWGLSEEQRRLMLGYPSRSTYHNWCRTAREHGTITLSIDALTRISAILRIHKALGVLFGNEHQRKDWLRTPHDALLFGGQKPLDLMTNGTLDGLMLVVRFLDAAQGGLYMAPNDADAPFSPYGEDEIIFR